MSAARNVFSARDEDLDAVRERLAREGIDVSRRSLASRIADDDSGVLVCEGDTVSWIVDGGALYLYDFGTSAAHLRAFLATLDLLARARFAAVLVANVEAESTLARELGQLGFVVDCTEADVSGGRVTQLATVVREVA